MTLFYRAKYHKLKYGADLNPDDLKPPSFDNKKDGNYTLEG